MVDGYFSACFYFRVHFNGLTTFYRIRRVLNEYKVKAIISDLTEDGYIEVILFDIYRRQADNIKIECKGSGMKELDWLTTTYLFKVLGLSFGSLNTVIDNFKSYGFFEDNERRDEEYAVPLTQNLMQELQRV